MAGISIREKVAPSVPQVADRGGRQEVLLTDELRRHHDSLRELCHDLLQPAATISALVAAAQVEAELPPATRDRLDQVNLQLKRITELCRHGLDGEAHATVLLHELVTQVAGAAGLTSEGVVGVRTEPSVVHGDATGLGRALANLLDNAVRAAGRDGQVTVTLRTVGDVVALTVADSGDGFGRGGTGVAGLGLRIAARVAHEHGGQLTLGQSVELGGAEMTLLLPSIFAGKSRLVLHEEVTR